MPDSQKSSQSTSSSSTSTSTSSSAPKASLAPAGESTDPSVHQLLAELETARSNSDDDGVKAAVDALAELGYSAG
jgi:hypothetical protein